MYNQRRICLVGATGLVGQTMIDQAVSRSDVRIIGVARREVPLPYGARMEMLLADPQEWDAAIAASNASVLVCALGTTIRKEQGDQAAFQAVDHDLVLACGRAAKQAGIAHMIVISSAGADVMAKNFYLRTKGRMEEGLSKLRFERLDIVRPGFLRGKRHGDIRPLERLAMIFAPVIDLFLTGKRREYRSLHVEVLARAIFALVRDRAKGHFVHEHDALLRAIRRAGG